MRCGVVEVGRKYDEYMSVTQRSCALLNFKAVEITETCPAIV
jgi:hypothetical protein